MMKAASVAFQSVADSFNAEIGDCRDGLDFQAFVAQLTPQVLSTTSCMANAAKSAAKVAKRLEEKNLHALRTRWKASLTKQKMLTKTAYAAVKGVAGFVSNPVGLVNNDGELCVSVAEACDVQVDMGVDEQVGTPQLQEDGPDVAAMPAVFGIRGLPREQALQQKGQREPTPLGLQAATELEANKWAKLWAEGSEYTVPS